MKFKTLLASALALLAVGCGEKQEEKKEMPAQSYELLTIQKQNASLMSNYSASIRGKQDIKIIPRVSGHLVSIKINEGSQVKKGQTMFVIDQVPYKAEVKAAAASVTLAKASVATAELNLKSKQELYNSDIVSDYDLQLAKNSLATAKAQLQMAEAQQIAAQNNLSYTEIKSPVNGVVGSLPYRVGDYVSPAVPNGLTIVANNSEMYVYFSMTERQVLDLINEYPTMDSAIMAMPAIDLVLNNNTTYSQKGVVESISGVVDQATGSLSVRASFPNAEGKLLSGGAGRVVMPYNKDNVVLIPQEATYEIQNKTYVYKVVDGTAVSTVVEIDKVNDGDNYIVLNGLKEGDVVIAKGAGLVREGTKVKMN